jgi:sarcosine oxidase delta subunit
MSESKLLPCPFCGSKSSLTEFEDMSVELAALRRESEERTAKLDALEAYVLLAKSSEEINSK